MKKVERRINTGREVKLEQRAEGATAVIAGVGAVCYDAADPGTEYVLWDYTYGDGGGERAVERILPGAFDQALSRPDDVRGLFNHSADLVLGRTKSGTMKLSVDATALSYEISPGNTSISKDVQEHLTRGDVSGSSIAFVVDEERWTETKDASGKWNVLREILSVTLYDVGPVTFPAYESTTAGMRADGEEGADEAKRALEAHRQKTRKPDVTGVLASYAARARAVEVSAAEERDDSLHPSTKQSLITAAEAVTAACASLVQKLVGLSTEDADVIAAISAADLALDQCDAIFDGLLGEPAEAEDAEV